MPGRLRAGQLPQYKVITPYLISGPEQIFIPGTPWKKRWPGAQEKGPYNSTASIYTGMIPQVLPTGIYLGICAHTVYTQKF